MRYFLTLLFIVFIYNAFAQKENGVEKLSKYKIDSLQSIHVDTIIHYYAYCGECEISAKPQCYMLSGYTLTENVLIYKQQGKYYTLDFDCNDKPAKRLLNDCKSIPYFISVTPILIARDKKWKYVFALQSDGGFEPVEHQIARPRGAYRAGTARS